MARAIWSGSISFGLLNVPVKLYSAVSKQTVRFRELREGDGSRVKHKRVAESDGKEVPYEKIVKGYEYAPDQYVILTKDELSDLEPQRSRAIEIQDFVDLDDIDPIYFEQPYYLGPDKGAARAYALLVQAMKESHKVAIARFVLRNKEHLAAIRPMGDVLTLTTMRFHDEVTSPGDLDGEVFEEEKPKKPDQREIEMAKQLIESLTGDFKPNSYRDEYREELLDLLESKAAGKEVVSAPTEEVKPTKAPDLMAALEESLAAVKGEEVATDGKASKAKPKPKPKAKSSSRSKSSSSKSKSSSSKNDSAATNTAAGSKKSTARKKAKA
jgi:DNA end-binding protein Ku